MFAINYHLNRGKCELNKNIREESEKKNDYLREDESLLGNYDMKQGEVANFISETVKDFPGTVSEEISQNLRKRLFNLNTQEKVRLALLANRVTRSLLIQSPIKMISLAVLKNPKITENEVLNYAQQKNLVEDVPLAIAKDTRWMRNYQIKMAIVSNPKTPPSVAIKFLAHLHDNDLKLLSRDKNVSSI